MNTNTRMVRVLSGYTVSATLIERRGDWAVVEMPSEALSLTHLPTGSHFADLAPEDADRIRPALRELAALEPFDVQSIKAARTRVVEVLARHGLTPQDDLIEVETLIVGDAFDVARVTP